MASIMTSVIKYYLRNTININLIRVMCIGLLVSCLFQFIFQMKHIGHGDYGYMQACWYVMMLAPRNIYRIYPLVFLFSVLFTMNQLNVSCELITLRVNGLSSKKIVCMVVSAIFSWILLITFIGEWVAPKLEYLADNKKIELLSGGKLVTGKHGVWINDNGWNVYVHQTHDASVLKEITRYNFAENHSWLIIEHAQKAVYKHPYWQLHDIKRTEINLTNNQIKVSKIPQRTWLLKIKPSLIKMISVPVEFQSLSQMYKTITVWHKYGHFDNEIMFAFWKRCVKPLLTVVLIVLTLPITMRLTRKNSKSKALVIAVITGLIAYLINEISGSLLLNYGIMPIFTAFFMIICYSIAGIMLCCRLK